jgi:hypothetical protein
MTEITLELPQNVDNDLSLSKTAIKSIVNNIPGLKFVRINYQRGENGSVVVKYKEPEDLYQLGIVLQSEVDSLKTKEEIETLELIMKLSNEWVNKKKG